MADAPVGKKGKTLSAKILLVDDRPDKLLALESLLADMNADVVKASSGREALRLLLKANFALILLDVSMPGMDGFETAALIRQRPKTEHTPIIFITSINTNETHMTKGYSLGAVDYIFTPVVPEVLKAKVAVFIDLFEKNETVRRQSESIAEEAARKAESLETRLRGLLNTLNLGVFRATLDGELCEANPAFFRILGARNLSDVKREYLAVICGVPDRRNELDGSTPAEDVHLVDDDGTDIWLSLTRTIRQDGKNDTFVEGIVEDITLRKTDEAKLQQLNETLELRVRERSEALRISQEHLSRAERLASLGTLAAGIAHEINNPLNSILLSAEYAMKHKDPGFVAQTLKAIAGETRRCGKIIRGVLQFARNERTAKSVNDLSKVVAHSVDLVKTYVRTPLKVDLELPNREASVVMNPTEIEQVVVNLVKNAAEASPSGAHVIVKIQPNGTRVKLSIKDHGPGIDASIKSKIFDPFFSTRTGSGGTGLGLSVAHGIILEHGGNVSIESDLGKGALFVIDFPMNSSGTQKAEGAENSAVKVVDRRKPIAEGNA